MTEPVASVELGGGLTAEDVRGMVVVGEWRDIARRFARNRLAVACSIVLVVMYAIMLLSYVWVGGKPITMPQDPYEYNLLRAMAPPSASHIIGTDRIGHDALSQVIEGSKISLNIGLASMAAAKIGRASCRERV